MITNAHSIAISKYKTKNLGDVCELVSGISAPQDSYSFSKEGVPFVRMKDLGKYHLTRNLVDTNDHLNREVVAKNNWLACPKNTILIPRSGSVHLNHRAILGRKAVIVNHILGLKIKSEGILPEFLYWVLTQYDMRQLMNQTTGLNMVRMQDIAKIEIPVPPKSTQKKIIYWLNKLDELTSLQAQKNELLDDLILSYYHSLFGSPSTYDTTFGVIKLRDLAKLNMGGTPSTKNNEYYDGGKINWIKSGEVREDFIYDARQKITLEGLNNSNAKLYNSGDVVIALNGQGKTRGTTAILRIDTASNQSVASISPNNKVVSEFLHFQLKQRYNELRSLTGDNQRSGLNLKILNDLDIIVPPIEKQKSFGVLVKEIEKIKLEQISLKNDFKSMFFQLTEKVFGSNGL